MPTRFKSDQDFYKKNEDDLLGNGNDDTSALKAGANPSLPLSMGRTYTETQLTAPGITTSRSFQGFRRAICFVTVASINTNVVVRIEAQAVSGGSWRSLMPRTSGSLPSDETIAANGTYGFYLDYPADALRFNFVSESGGTAATLDVEWRFST